jgi:hypothetical protein
MRITSTTGDWVPRSPEGQHNSHLWLHENREAQEGTFVWRSVRNRTPAAAGRGG